MRRENIWIAGGVFVVGLVGDFGIDALAHQPFDWPMNIALSCLSTAAFLVWVDRFDKKHGL